MVFPPALFRRRSINVFRRCSVYSTESCKNVARTAGTSCRNVTGAHCSAACLYAEEMQINLGDLRAMRLIMRWFACDPWRVDYTALLHDVHLEPIKALEVPMVLADHLAGCGGALETQVEGRGGIDDLSPAPAQSQQLAATVMSAHPTPPSPHPNPKTCPTNQIKALPPGQNKPQPQNKTNSNRKRTAPSTRRPKKRKRLPGQSSSKPSSKSP